MPYDFFYDAEPAQQKSKAPQGDDELVNALRKKNEEVMSRFKMLEDKIKKLEEQNEMMMQEIKFQGAVQQDIIRIARTGRDRPGKLPQVYYTMHS